MHDRQVKHNNLASHRDARPRRRYMTAMRNSKPPRCTTANRLTDFTACLCLPAELTLPAKLTWRKNRSELNVLAMKQNLLKIKINSRIILLNVLSMSITKVRVTALLLQLLGTNKSSSKTIFQRPLRHNFNILCASIGLVNESAN